MKQVRPMPVPGEFYRHFKNRMYQIVAIAYHSENQEPMVVYQALYGEFKVWVRPLDMFMEEVDHGKYPDVEQMYRFERVARPGESAELKTSDTVKKSFSGNHSANPSVSEAGMSRGFSGYSAGREKSGYEPEPRPMSPHLLAFFDAMDEKRYDKMLEALAKLSGTATQKEIDDICMVLDMQTVGVSIMEQVSDIRRHIQMLRKFDGERLR